MSHSHSAVHMSRVLGALIAVAAAFLVAACGQQSAPAVGSSSIPTSTSAAAAATVAVPAWLAGTYAPTSSTCLVEPVRPSETVPSCLLGWYQVRPVGTLIRPGAPVPVPVDLAGYYRLASGDDCPAPSLSGAPCGDPRCPAAEPRTDQIPLCVLGWEWTEGRVAG